MTRLLAIGCIGFACWSVLSGLHEAGAGQTLGGGKNASFNLEWRLRYENRQNMDFCMPNQRDCQDEFSRVRLNFSTILSPDNKLVARLQHSYKRNILAGSPTTQHKSGFQQMYWERQWQNLSLRVGRQELGFGDYRLLLLSNLDNVGYTWDAVRLGIKEGPWRADVFYGRPGMFPTNTTHPVLYGVYATYSPSTRWQSDVYLLRKEVIASGTQQRIWAVGARPTFQLTKDTKLVAEAVLQSGKVGSKDLRAGGYWARLEHQLPGMKNTKLILQYDFASGGNPDDATVHTLDQLFGTTFGMCGRMGLQGWRNMRSWRVGLSGAPSPRLQYTADIHLNRLANAQDYWYGGGGSPVKGVDGVPLRDPTGSAGTNVGTEVNLTLTYALSEGLQVSAGYARFIPGSFVLKMNRGFADNADWFYLQTSYKF
ncbi:MAG: alginate export family protein [Armatimonadota bacterium]